MKKNVNRKRKKLEELTIKHTFLFGAVMSDEDNCKDCLELALGFPIEKVTVCKEKSIVYHPEYKGVRLDVVAKDENHTHYNIEMQIASKPALGKRARYYHSQLDMEMLETGQEYQELADSYVIFICDYDPFGKRLYRYTWDMVCQEDASVMLQDGSHTIFLSTCGENDADVPEELVKFLKFVGAESAESLVDYEDAYVRRLQESVAHIKTSREMEAKFMLWKEMIQEEREEGREEGRLEGITEVLFEILEDLPGKVPDELEELIWDESDPKVLKRYVHLATRASTVDEFEKLVKDSQGVQ